MKWFEFIRLQAGGEPREKVCFALSSLVKGLADKPGLLEARLYFRASSKSDFAITLLWETKEEHFTGSIEGLSIKEALRQFGLVDHSVWIRKQEH